MRNSKIAKATRGSLIHFIKGHLLESSFDKTYLHYFGIVNNDRHPDFELWSKSHLSYLSEVEIILLLNDRGLKTVHKDSDKELKQFLKWCDQLEQFYQNHEKLGDALHIWKSHCLFLLAIKNESKLQRKLLKVALAELQTLTGKAIETHPYLFYLRGLINVALNDWEAATCQFHQASSYTHNPMLYKLLIKMYIQLEMPGVSHFFQSKLKALNKDNNRSAIQALELVPDKQ